LGQIILNFQLLQHQPSILFLPSDFVKHFRVSDMDRGVLRPCRGFTLVMYTEIANCHREPRKSMAAHVTKGIKTKLLQQQKTMTFCLKKCCIMNQINILHLKKKTHVSSCFNSPAQFF